MWAGWPCGIPACARPSFLAARGLRAPVTAVGTALRRLLGQPRERLRQCPVLNPRVCSRPCVCEPPRGHPDAHPRCSLRHTPESRLEWPGATWGLPATSPAGARQPPETWHQLGLALGHGGTGNVRPCLSLGETPLLDSAPSSPPWRIWWPFLSAVRFTHDSNGG